MTIVANFRLITSTEELDAQDIFIYPNPFTNNFILEMGLYNQDSYRVNLLDANGKLLSNLLTVEHSTTTSYQIDAVASLESGTYLLEIMSDNKLPTIIKLIKL